MASTPMRRREFGALALGALGAAAFGRQVPQVGWTPLWNNQDLSGWTTWMQRPEPTSEVPGLARDANAQFRGAVIAWRHANFIDLYELYEVG